MNLQELLYNKLFSSKTISAEDRVILAVSGGIDSMVMAELFLKLEIEILIAHCNFKLRGKESDEEEKFVRDYCTKKAIPLQVKVFDTLEHGSEKGISIQMAARELRYDWFDERRNQTGFNYIATAHNLDDQIETFFINLSRGTGIRGLTGIALKSGAILRPLVHFSRNEIHKYAVDNSISWREDSSNSSVKYKRNKIRHELLPLFRVLNPSFDRSMEENIKKLSMVRDIYDQYIELRKDLFLRRTKDSYEIDIELIEKEEFGEAVLYEILSDFNFNPATIKDVWNSLQSTPGKKFYSDSHRLVKDRKKLIIDLLREPYPERYYIEENQKQVEKPLNLLLERADPNDFIIPPYPDIACLDADLLDFPLILRKWKPGDFFHPLGMLNSKKLSDFFVDNKFSLHQKENTWLLCSGQEVAWVVGYRIDERFKITKDTSEILKITLK
jgi:tRNA(Ile)-lysidine synthase